MNKPIKPNITIPESFAVNGVKADFDNNKILNGFDRIQPDVLAGDNLNKFIDDTYKGLNYGMAATDALNLINEGETLIVKNGEFTSGAISGMPVGVIYPLPCSPSYVPEGSLPCDGTEYTQAQFSDLWNNYLNISGTPLLNTCTYSEYEADLATYGQCAKFAVDTANETFRVPLIKDGAVIQQAMSNGELGKSYNAGLPNITGQVLSSGGINAYEENPAGSAVFGTNQGSRKVAANAASNFNLYASLGFDASRSNPIYGNSDTVQGNAVALRHFVVVATGSINESMMDWSAWASSLQGKADKTGVDGQYVISMLELANNASTSSSDTEYDLSSYLPDDGYTYDVLFNGYCIPTKTKHKLSTIILQTDIVTNQAFLCSARCEVADVEALGYGSTWLPVGIGRKVIVVPHISDYFSGRYGLQVIGYRRVGTNG